MDITKRFKAIAEAAQKRDTWARKGLELVEAGKIEDAKKAEEKAKYWDRRIKELERLK